MRRLPYTQVQLHMVRDFLDRIHSQTVQHVEPRYAYLQITLPQVLITLHTALSVKSLRI